MFNFWGRWFQRQCRQSQRRTTSRRAFRTRPQLEVLEDRVVPAGNLTLDVTSTVDSVTQAGTLRNAIQTANTDFANGTATNITISILTAGAYQITLPGTPGESDNLAGEFAIFTSANTPVGSSLTIQNNSGGNVAIDAANHSRVFDINPTNIIPANNTVLGAVTINGVTIENGLAQPGDAAGGSGGGIRDQGPVDLTLNNDIVTNNNATADGGGISMENVVSTKWALTLNATTVSNNHAGDAGGGIEEDGTGKVFINAGTIITGNTCVNQGAGIWLDAVNGGTANLTINGAFIAGNTAGMLGGGVGNAGNGNVIISNSTLQDNTSTGFGGGFADQNNLGTLTVQNSLFVGNKAGTNGGGIQEGNITTITNSEIKNNAAGVNGMMAIGTTGNGAANAVEGSGGGLFINGGTLTLSNSTVADNTAEINGGGIELQTTGSAIITNSTISFNTALFNTPSTVLAPSVFLNNGGGIDDAATGPVALIDDTVSHNFANNGGGLFFAGATGLTLQNTIVARNTVSGAGPDIDFTGAIAGVDLGGNLIGVSGAGSGNAGAFPSATTQTGTVGTPLDPLLADLRSNGGPQVGSSGHQIILETVALQPGSPAIGKGVANGVTTDERGQLRPTPPSVGAFEFNAAVLTTTPAATPVVPAVAGNETLVVTSTVDSLTQVGTLRNAIQTANTDLASGAATSVTISIQTAGLYQIKLAGTPGESDNAAGEFALFTSPNTPVGSSLTIQNDSGGNVTIDGGNQNRVFDINPTNIIPANNTVLGAVTINGVTIENGLAQPGDAAGGSGGGIRDQGPVDLTLNNDVITNNSATADGGGISMENVVSTKWALTLNATTVSGNHAGDAGGGVEEDGTGKVFVNMGSIIADNTTINQGAGIWLDAVAGGTANLTVTGAYIAGNTAGMTGGGVGNAGNGNVILSNSTLQDNTTTGFGGGFGDQNNLGTLLVQNSFFLGNKAGTNGGAIQEGNGATITNSEFNNNVAGVNGMAGIGTTGTTGMGAINAVEGSGGGLFINGGTLTLSTSTLSNNTAEINGGGIELQTTGLANITNSTISGNTALFNAPSTVGAPSVFLNNGGGIDDAATGAVSLFLDTLTNNFANNGGGIFFAGTTGLQIQNTILAQNIASAVGPDVDFTGVGLTGVDQGGNLIGIADNGGDGVFTGATTQTGTFANPLNPQVMGLANNGGPLAGSPGHQITLETEALLPGSPAIGKGVLAATIDERGFPRLTPHSVGAFEFQNTTLTVTVTPASSTLVLNNSETVTVTITNTGANALPLDNSTVEVTLSIGGTTATAFTATLGPLAVGQSQNFTVMVNGTTVGQQTITGAVTSPDTNPTTATGSATVTVTPTPTPTPPPHTPVGTLTIFAFGFGPGGGIDLFEVDTRGSVFAMPFFGGGGLLFINTAVQLPIVVFNGQILAFLSSSAGQNFIIDIVNPFNPFVLGPVLVGLHI